MRAVRWAFRVGSWHPTEQDWMKCATLIQPEEKERIGRFVFKKDAKSSMAGRLLIRKFIIESTELRNGEVELARDERGKPFLASPSLPEELVFNVSHQGEFAVLAGSTSSSSTSGTSLLGVDVMKLEYSGGKTLEEFFRIMDRNFSQEEWRAIRSSGDSEARLAAFCRHWSLKESYVKATGTGITVPLQDISFSTPSRLQGPLQPLSDTLVRVRGHTLGGWTFEETMLDGQHCVAVARNFEAEVAPFQELSYAELIRSCEPVIPEDPHYASSFWTKDEKPR